MTVLPAPSRLPALLAESVDRRPLDAGAPIVVYGAGATGRRVIRQLRARGHTVAAVLDQRGGSGMTAEGIAVHRPGSEPIERADAIAVVGVFNRDADVDEIHRQLCAAGYGRVVGIVELHDLLGGADQYWLASRDVARQQAGAVRSAAALWADDASRALYDDIIAYRLTGDSGLAPRPCTGPQYFPADIPRPDAPMRYVDCGAYDGDTLHDATSAGVVEAYCAFEPDAGNFARLSERAQKIAPASGVYLWPCAVDASTGTRRFAAGAGEASALDESGSLVVQCVAIDDVLPVFAATDLKMDIEGAEPEALQGARRLIARSRPRLAICVYHRPDHLWSIPLAIAALDLEYSLYLRAHAHGGFDVVLYAVPREQLSL